MSRLTYYIFLFLLPISLAAQNPVRFRQIPLGENVKTTTSLLKKQGFKVVKTQTKEEDLFYGTHPEVFFSIGVFSSGMFGGVGPGAYAPFSVESQLPELLADPAAFNAAHDVFYMSCGEGDPRIEHTRAAAEALQAAGANVHFTAWPGAHEWQPWRKSLHEFCQMLFK